MKTTLGIFVVAVCLTVACTPSDYPTENVENTPIPTEHETITDMDFESGQIEPEESAAATTPVPQAEDGTP